MFVLLAAGAFALTQSASFVRIPPHYPEAAVQAGVMAGCSALFDITVSGVTSNICVTCNPSRQRPDRDVAAEFERAAADGIRHWRYIDDAFLPPRVAQRSALNEEGERIMVRPPEPQTNFAATVQYVELQFQLEDVSAEPMRAPLVTDRSECRAF